MAIEAARQQHEKYVKLEEELLKPAIKTAYEERDKILAATEGGSASEAQRNRLKILSNDLFKVLPSRALGEDRDTELKNFTQYSFGEVVAIAGDYIADPLQSISSVLYPRPPKNSEAALEEAFYDAYNYMKKYQGNPFFFTAGTTESGILPNLRGLFNQEYGALQKYADSADKFSILHQFMSGYTLGAKVKSMVFGVSTPHATELLEENYDHFGVDAHHVYRAGHTLACKVAKVAAFHKAMSKKPGTPVVIKGNHRKAASVALNEAYAMEAFSLHFASDLFSAGHARTPRREASLVVNGVFTEENPWSILASKRVGFLANAQHDEDGTLGLKAHNRRKDRWEMYGDYSLFDYRSAGNRKVAVMALMKSVQEIEKCFSKPGYKAELELLTYVPSRVESDHTPLTRIGAGNVLELRKSYQELDTDQYQKVGAKDAVAALGGRDKKYSIWTGVMGPVIAFFSENGVLETGRMTKNFSRYLDYVDGYRARTHKLYYIYCYDEEGKYKEITLTNAILAIKKDGTTLNEAAYDPSNLPKAFFYPYKDLASTENPIPIRENTANANRAIIKKLQTQCVTLLGAGKTLTKIEGAPSKLRGGDVRYYPIYGLNYRNKLVQATLVPKPRPIIHP